MDTDDEDQIRGEATQLRWCRWAFLLLGAWQALSLVLLLLIVFEEPPKKKELVTPPIEWYLGPAAVMALTTLPAGAILLSCKRSTRWRVAALAFLILVTLDILTLGCLAYVRPGGVTLEGPEPWAPRILAYVTSFLGWGELWFLAILVAEFALASRAEEIVESTENLGYALMIGAMSTIGQCIWSLPSGMPLDPHDVVGVSLALLNLLVAVWSGIWSIRLVDRSAALARMMIARSARRLDQTDAPSDEPC